MASPTPKTYEGSCHCGQIQFTVTLPEALAPEGKGKIGRCNCSICTKNGYFLVYPQRGDVHFLNDSDEKMKTYTFGKHLRAHRFCPQCSSSVLIDYENVDIERLRPLLAVNASLFKDVDLENAELSRFDGRNLL